MKSQSRIARSLAGFAAALLIGGAGAAVAGAEVTASGGDGTVVDTDGTQGTLGPAVQGKQDGDGDQDARLTGSPMAVPQFKATPK